MRAYISPLRIGTDTALDARIVWYLLGHYGLLDSRARLMLRDLADARIKTVEVDVFEMTGKMSLAREQGGEAAVDRYLDSLNKGKVAPADWRELFPKFPVTIASLRITPDRLALAVDPRARAMCPVQQAFQFHLRSDPDRRLALVLSDGSGPIAEKPVMHNMLASVEDLQACWCGEARSPFEICTFAELLTGVDRAVPPSRWQAELTAGFSDPAPRRPSLEEFT